MPFVKVTESLIVNTDRVIAIDCGESIAQVYLTHPLRLAVGEGVYYISIPLAAASVLLDLLEVSQAFDFDPKPEDYAVALTSRLAQTLRDTQPYGATVAQLAALANETDEATFDALCALVVEGVVKTNPEIDGRGAGILEDTANPTIWFHASHAPKSQAPPAEQETEGKRYKIHGEDEVFPHADCDDPARCICECLTCKRAWNDAGRPKPSRDPLT